MNIVRIEGTIQCSSKTLSQLLYDDYECIKYCDSMMETFEIVERFDDNNLAAYYKAKSYFGFDARYPFYGHPCLSRKLCHKPGTLISAQSEAPLKYHLQFHHFA